MDAVGAVLAQSFILGIMVLGVYISYKILDFPDLSVDGSFSLGGAIAAISLQHGFSGVMAALFAGMAGLIAGFFTGVLHVKLKISNLLSGILVMGILYSVNLRIMGKANIPLFHEKHIFKMDTSPLVFALILLCICKCLLDLFLKTGMGYTLKAVGDNPQMVQSLGIEIGKIKILGLMASNGLVSFAGSIMAQYQGFADVSMGIGTLILGIASIIIGQASIQKLTTFKETTVILFGTIFYQLTIFLALNLGLAATDLKIITSFVIILFLGAGQFKNIDQKKWLTLRRWSYAKGSKPIKKFS
ncbi:ABC transporter permease [Clostridiaceae bacterium 35-E11]